MAAILTPEMRALLEDAAARGVETARIVLGRHTQRGPKLRPSDDEFEMQRAFFDTLKADPALCELPIYAVPNFAGHYGSKMARMLHGARALAAGRRKGVPDVCVDIARGGWHGLRIEFKTDRNTVSAEQRDWRARLERQGFHVVVCRSTHDALDVLTRYLAAARTAAPDRQPFGDYPASKSDRAAAAKPPRPLRPSRRATVAPTRGSS